MNITGTPVKMPSRNIIVKGLSYQFHYELDDQYPLVKEIVECAHILKAHQMTAVFVILPLPYGYLQEYLSNDYVQLVDKNVRFLDSLLQNDGDHVLDLSHSVAKEAFLWETYPNSHLRHEGRLTVALELSKFIKTLK